MPKRKSSRKVSTKRHKSRKTRKYVSKRSKSRKTSRKQSKKRAHKTRRSTPHRRQSFPREYMDTVPIFGEIRKMTPEEIKISDEALKENIESLRKKYGDKFVKSIGA